MNTSPEPFTNIGVSVAEDAAVAGLALAIANPRSFWWLLLVVCRGVGLPVRFILRGLQATISQLASRRTATAS